MIRLVGSHYGLGNNHYGECPKCDGRLFTIPYYTNADKQVTAKKFYDDEKEFLVLLCDRCGQFMVFEGFTGDCASFPRSKCEICGIYYCNRGGITVDIDVDDKRVELRYCNDHIPEWYKNR